MVTAEVFGHPDATEAASVAKSVATAALMAMGSPADTADLEVIVSPVCPATVSMFVKSVFHCAAVTRPPADTVEMCDSPNPYCAAPVPAK